MRNLLLLLVIAALMSVNMGVFGGLAFASGDASGERVASGSDDEDIDLLENASDKRDEKVVDGDGEVDEEDLDVIDLIRKYSQTPAV